MPTYALIDNACGYVWGVTVAESPIAACAAVDAEIGGEPRRYEEVGSFDHANAWGYHVHAAPEGFTVNDGQNDDEIAAVEALPRVACVLIHDAA